MTGKHGDNPGEDDDCGADEIGREVIDLYRENKDQMSDAEVRELISRLHDERNRRKSRGRKGERPEWPTAGTIQGRYADNEHEEETNAK
jgi:DNA-directed RNA polymerase beta' subunit